MTEIIDLHNFPPPKAAANLYVGAVMHARLKPVSHRFVYRVFSLLIDLGRLEDAGKASPFFSIGKFNLLSFLPPDHLWDKVVPLLDQVRAKLAPANVIPDKVLLLCYPRVLGFVFNPLSIYYCYRQDEPVAIIYEVRNTFGQAHSYIVPITAGQMNEAGIRQERAKQFYVSPFMDMDLAYRFRLLPPGDTLNVRILETSANTAIFTATFHGVRQDLTSSNVLRAFFGLPLMTIKVVAAIHFEALKLWLKGMRLRARPAPPPATSLETEGNN